MSAKCWDRRRRKQRAWKALPASELKRLADEVVDLCGRLEFSLDAWQRRLLDLMYSDRLREISLARRTGR
jgi:hypothetical protein